MVVTSVALAGTCLGSRFGTAFTAVKMARSKPTARVVNLQFVRDMFSRNNADHDYGSIR